MRKTREIFLYPNLLISKLESPLLHKIHRNPVGHDNPVMILARRKKNSSSCIYSENLLKFIYGNEVYIIFQLVNISNKV